MQAQNQAFNFRGTLKELRGSLAGSCREEKADHTGPHELPPSCCGSFRGQTLPALDFNRILQLQWVH